MREISPTKGRLRTASVFGQTQSCPYVRKQNHRISVTRVESHPCRRRRQLVDELAQKGRLSAARGSRTRGQPQPQATVKGIQETPSSYTVNNLRGAADLCLSQNRDQLTGLRNDRMFYGDILTHKCGRYRPAAASRAVPT